MCGRGGGGHAVEVVVCLSVCELVSAPLPAIAMKLLVVVGDGVRHVCLPNRPNPSRFG